MDGKLKLKEHILKIGCPNNPRWTKGVYCKIILFSYYIFEHIILNNIVNRIYNNYLLKNL
jgi:hypothetical protein